MVQVGLVLGCEGRCANSYFTCVKCIDEGISSVSVRQNHLKGLLKHRSLDSTPRFSDPVYFRWGLRICNCYCSQGTLMLAVQGPHTLRIMDNGARLKETSPCCGQFPLVSVKVDNSNLSSVCHFPVPFSNHYCGTFSPLQFVHLLHCKKNTR